MVIIKVEDDDVKILPEIPNDGNLDRIYKFPLNKTLRVDLDLGTVEGLKSVIPKKKGFMSKLLKKEDPETITSLDKVYIHGQVVEDYPAIYVTISDSLQKLKESIQKVDDEDIMEDYMEVRDKNNKKIQNGGSWSKRGGYLYRKKGGMNIIKLSKISLNLNGINKLLKKLGLKGGTKIDNKMIIENKKGGKNIKNMMINKIKNISKLSRTKLNKGFEQINKMSKTALKMFKGGSVSDLQKIIKKMNQKIISLKKKYIGGNYCGGSNHKNCKYCKKGGSSSKKGGSSSKKGGSSCQNGGSSCQNGGSIDLSTLDPSKINEMLSTINNINKAMKQGKEMKEQSEEILKMQNGGSMGIEKSMKYIIKTSSDGFEKINKLAKKGLKYFKGGNMRGLNKCVKDMKKEMKKY